MPNEDRIESNEKEILKKRENTFNVYYNIEALSLSRNILIEENYSLSFAWIIYRTILRIDVSVFMSYNKENMKYLSVYRKLFQYEYDEIFEECIKANKLDLTLNPKINPNNDLSYLNSDEQSKLLEVYSGAINKYFDIMIRYNKDYLEEEEKFLAKMIVFGKNHGVSEEDMVIFANNALKSGINIAEINSQEELDELYNKIYPKA